MINYMKRVRTHIFQVNSIVIIFDFKRFCKCVMCRFHIFFDSLFRRLALSKAILTFSQSGSVNFATVYRLIGCLHTNFQHISGTVNFARADTEHKCSAKKGCFCSQKRCMKSP